jgi:hypothetical protein
MGDVKEQSLEEIWNGEAYHQFRRAHIDLSPSIRCTNGTCDMHALGKFLI